MSEFQYSKVIKKAAKIFLISLLAFSILCGTLYSVIVTPYFQTRLTHVIAGYLSGKLNAKVEVRGVDIEFFKKIVLEGFYVEDLHHDTLIYADKLKADILHLETQRGIIKLNEVILEHGKFYLRQYINEQDINLQFILDKLASSDTTAGKPITLSCKSLELKDVAFCYKDMNKPLQARGIDFTDLCIATVNGKFSALQIKGDTILGTIENLSCVEKSGFILRKLSCIASVCPRSVICTKLDIETNQSKLKGEYSMFYNHYTDFKDYIRSVRMVSKLENSEVNMGDIAYFADDLFGMTQTARLTGEFDGTVSHFKGKKALIEIGSKTKLSGDFSIRGLPDIRNTFFEFQIASLQADKKSIEEIPLPPFESKNHIFLPDNISELGLIKYKGKFTGFVNDFVAYGKFSTALGNFSSDINLKYDGDNSSIEYSGRLNTDNFFIGKFLAADQYLGAITGNTEISGTGLKKETMSARVNGKIESIYFNGYTYHDITVSGDVAKKLFSGKMLIADPNLAMNFDGTIDFTHPQPIFDFNSVIAKANLKKLNLLDRDSSASLATDVSIHLSGDNLDNITGSVWANKTIFSEKGKNYKLDSLVVSSAINENQRAIKLSSDLVSGEVSGMFNIGLLPQSVNEIIARIVPSYRIPSNTGERNENKQQFLFVFDLKNTKPITDLFLPQLMISAGTQVSGNFNSVSSEVSLAVFSDSLSAYGISFSQLDAKGETKNDVFQFDAMSNKVALLGGLSSDLFQVNALLGNDTMQFRLQLSNTDSSLHRADLKGTILFSKDRVSLVFLPSGIVVNNETWQINEQARLDLDSISLSASNLTLMNGIQKITANGALFTRQTGEEGKKEMKLDMSNFDLSGLGWYLDKQGVNLGGIINGTVTMAGSISHPGLNCAIGVRNFAFNDDTIGTASVNATYEYGDQYITLSSWVGKEDVKTIEITGRYLLNKPADCLDLDASFQKTYLQKFGRYFLFAKDLRGIASGNLHISGNFSEPVVTGYVLLQKTSFSIDYLNTSYNFTDQLLFTPNGIEFNNIQVNDRNGHIARASGKITHEHFKNFVFDVTILPKNFECLNTNAGLNSMYFGTANATGTVTIKGPLNAMVMNVAVKSDKGTKIFIPLSNPEEVSQHNFITFVSHDTTTCRKPEYTADLSGLQLNMDLELTPDAEVQIIFDSKIGDIIKGNGSGNLKLEINTLGDFNMYGEYLISEGEYLFTLKNVVNKKFIIEKGGTITWNGSPLDAEINLDAVYSLRTTLSTLLPDEPQTNDAVYKRRPIECWMNMTGKLLNPVISFDVNIPNLEIDNSAVADRVKSYISTEEQKTQQVMSLLVVKQFVPAAEVSQGAGPAYGSDALNSNGKELLSNQLNNWVSQVTNKLDVGVKVTEDELGASLGKRLFNNRLILDGSVRYASNTSTTSAASTTNNSGVVGDANAEYLISKDGKFRVKSFYKSNSGLYSENDVSRQGAGIMYKTEFDNLRELRIRNRLERLRKKLSKNTKVEESKEVEEPPVPGK